MMIPSWLHLLRIVRKRSRVYKSSSHFSCCPSVERLESRLALTGRITSPFRWETGLPYGPAAMAVGDFNNDGNLDFVTVNSGDNTVSVLLVSRNGTFLPGPATSCVVGTNPQGAAVEY